jgi:hypothetical protein
MRTILIPILVILCSIAGCSKKPETPPVESVLDIFGDAVATLDTESMISLFLAPDDTPEGLNRQKNIDEIRKDWANASAANGMRIAFENIQFDIKADMIISGGEAVGNEKTPVNLNVVLVNNEWKIETMNYSQQDNE